MANRGLTQTAGALVPFHLLGITGVFALVAAVPALVGYLHWSGEQDMRAAWSISGPPCPAISKPTPAIYGSRDPLVFDYGGATFARRFGHVACIPVVEGPPWNKQVRRICQFTAPDVVAVSAAGGTKVFKPGVGHAATVTISGGEVACVVGGWYRG
ncbi:MAG: hypothetical protein ACK41C_13265 [Phenylobacterium sp.]|jgi:hypothetical protein|uniref:hypothetical protein n=1 Tax=Phenylobacterium sp. TaxID=1871053 RepID=UPI0039188938